MTESVLARWEAELVLDAHAELGEAPHWDTDTGELVWVDIMAGAVHRLDPRRGVDCSFEVGQPVGAAVPRVGGGFVLALRDGIGVVDGIEGGALRWIATLELESARTRMNDAACDAAGRLWAGTMDTEETEPIGSLYRIAATGAVKTMLSGVTVSNGLGWSPDGRVLYYVDSPHSAVEAFDFDPLRGTIGNRRQVCAIEPQAGVPDGLTVDAEGCVWVALWGGWSIRRYTSKGRLIGLVDVPAARVTSCTFGGAELDTLYVTTARPDAPDARQPHAGGVFSVRPGSRGLPAHRFAG
jgi:sugar lactone lactonase YvrE